MKLQYAARRTMTVPPQITTARRAKPGRYEASGALALLPPRSIPTAIAAQAPIPCAENFRASKFAWSRLGSCHRDRRRKHWYRWRMRWPPPERKYFRAVRTEKKSALSAPVSAECLRRNQRFRGAGTPHRSSRNRHDYGCGCRFHSRSASESRSAPRCSEESRVRLRTGRGQIRGRLRCVRS